MSALDRVRFHRLSTEWGAALACFFNALAQSGAESTFHPHPLTAEAARRLAAYAGRDEYHVASCEASIVAYGMLRGWDEGYDIPSLGLAVHPDWQGRGIGRGMMEHLHRVARERGARQIRLKVYPGNEVALNLYEGLGYRFACGDDDQRVGVLTL